MEVALAHFEVGLIFRHLTGNTEKNRENFPTSDSRKIKLKEVTTSTAAACAMADCFLFKLYAEILQQSDKMVINGELVNVSKCSRLLHCVTKY